LFCWGKCNVLSPGEVRIIYVQKKLYSNKHLMTDPKGKYEFPCVPRSFNIEVEELEKQNTLFLVEWRGKFLKKL